MLTSIKVPPLKSIPKFNPLKKSTPNEIIIAAIEKIKKFFLKPRKLTFGSTGIILFRQR